MELSKKALKFIAVVSGISLLARLYEMLLPLLPMFIGAVQKEAASVGIIGGADGPTAIYVATKAAPPFSWLFSLCTLAEIILFVFLFVKAVKALRNHGVK